MNKRLLIALLVAVAMLGLGVLTAAATDFGEEEVKVEIQPCWDGSTLNSLCIPYPRVPATLESGKVQVDEAGIVKIEIKGVAPNATFVVYFGDWFPSWHWQAIGSFTTDANGEWDDTFPYIFGPGAYQGKFAFNYGASGGLRQFITEEATFIR